MIPKKIFRIWLSDKPDLPEMIDKCFKSQEIEGYEVVTVTMANCPVPSQFVLDAIKSKKWAKAVD